MNEEKRIILDKIDTLLTKRTAELIKELPDVHEVSDGIIIRFFGEWDNCEDDNAIKYKKLINHDDPDESVVFFYIPKGAIFDLNGRYHIGCITCLNGAIDINTPDGIKFLENYSKICVNSDDVKGRAFENTYLIVTSNRKDWKESTLEHQKKMGNLPLS
jgi:hypothetical protein